MRNVVLDSVEHVLEIDAEVKNEDIKEEQHGHPKHNVVVVRPEDVALKRIKTYYQEEAHHDMKHVDENLQIDGIDHVNAKSHEDVARVEDDCGSQVDGVFVRFQTRREHM